MLINLIEENEKEKLERLKPRKLSEKAKKAITFLEE